MSTKTESGEIEPPIESRADLIGVFSKGEKTADRWRIGTEHERPTEAASHAVHCGAQYEGGGGIGIETPDVRIRAGKPAEGILRLRAFHEGGQVIIEIGDDGTISIACVNSEGGEQARKRILDITAEVEVGKIYDGTVLKLLDFGAIVSVLPGKDGLLHISQISQERVNQVSDYLKEGQQVKVKVLESDEKGRIRLSMKAVAAEAAAH